MNAGPVVGIVTLGAANARSIAHALRRAGAQPRDVLRPSELREIDALVVPGVANLRYLLEAIDRDGWRAPLCDRIASGLPALGICAGFQLFFESSEEAPARAGLGIFEGRVVRLRGAKVPHMGWNRVEAIDPSVPGGWAYFAHSYAAPASARATVAVTDSGTPIACVARSGNATGVQFHPERSARYGAAFLESFLAQVRVPVYVG